VLIVANLLATVLRFLMYRSWVFGNHSANRQHSPRNSIGTDTINTDTIEPFVESIQQNRSPH
jgi:hypothetical protein